LELYTLHWFVANGYLVTDLLA